MTLRACIVNVETSEVVNIIEYDPQAVYNPVEGYRVEISASHEIGDIFTANIELGDK